MPSDQIDLESALDEHLSLTDQDVDILHQIITRAEQHPDVHRLPFRAIFSAYDDVLYEHGVDPRQDEVCFRFLFLLGSREIEGRGLYEKFVTLLARMGIQLAYDDDEHVHAEKHDEGDGKVLARRDRRGSEMKKRAIAAAPATISRIREKPKRRASFNSMYDATEDISQRPTKRPSSRSSVSRLETGSEIPRLWREIDELEPVPVLPAAVTRAGSSERNQSHSRRPSQSHKRTSSGRDQAVLIARHLPLEELADPEIDAKFEVYTANKKQKQARREVNGDAEHSSSTSSTTSISDDDDHLNDINENNDDEPPLDRDNSPIPAAHLPRELVYKPTLSSLLRDASTFNMYRERNNLRNYFRTWCAKASRHRELFSHLYATAETRDSMTLKRQAFDLWRSALAEKRHKVQTQKLFENLEQRAGRARDLYLLGHTLSIWRGKAAAETEKTKSARAHILAVKYFTAWEELTAARELQIRKFTLNKPFRLWREKLPLIQQHERTADAIYRRHLIRTIYWRWFWAFCERRAPSYRNSSLKQKHLILWIRALRTNHEREREAIAQDGHVLVQASFQTWKAKREIMAEAEDVAVMRWKHKRLRDCLTEWNVKTRLGHAAYYTTVAINTRIAKSAFDTWLQRSRQQRLARDYQNYRLLKSAWTNWNDKLRVQALGQRIDERILMQVLYKWLLLGRQQLMQRIHDQRLLRETFDKMFVQSKKNFNKLLNREDKFRIHWQQKLMRGKLEKWRDKIQCLKQREFKAMEFYGPRLSYDFLIVWHKRLEWLQGYMKVADEVRRRRLMTDYLTKWRESTKNHIKQHRLNAYAIFRRKHKMALASHALNTWNSKTHAISDMQATADTHHTAQTKSLSENCFRHWFTVTSNRAGDMHNADIHYNRKLVRAYLDRILDLRLIHRDQEEQSTQLLTAHISRVAAAQLRKLSLRLFQIRANWETADRQKERSVRKQIKGVFRIWLGQARDARALRRSTLLGSARGAHSMSRGGVRVSDENVVPSTPPTLRPWSRSRRSLEQERRQESEREGEGQTINTPMRNDITHITPRTWSRISRRGEERERERGNEREMIGTPMRSGKTPSLRPWSRRGIEEREQQRQQEQEQQQEEVDYQEEAEEEEEGDETVLRTPTRGEIPERPRTASGALRTTTPANGPATPSYLTGSVRPHIRTKQLSADATTTTPATPSITPFAARFLAQLSTGNSGPQSSGGSKIENRRIFHRRGKGNSSLATVRFADDEEGGEGEGDEEDDDDPEQGSPSKGRSTLRSSFQTDLEEARMERRRRDTAAAAAAAAGDDGDDRDGHINGNENRFSRSMRTVNVRA